MRCGTARSRCTAASPEQDVSQAAVTPLPERSTHAALTICARNYFAQARVLAASFKAWHPEIDFHLVMVDRKDEAFAAAHPDLHITWVEDLGLAQLPQLRLRFDVIELCTNIKALCLRRLLRDYRSVVYLDPDTCVYARLDAVHQALSRQAIVLTPASLSPVLDGHRPDDIEWLRVGAFNLGFIGVSATGDGPRFLDWWSARCLAHGFHDTPTGVFLDQKWIDLVPAFFAGHEVLRDPGLNVAAWNLHERRLSRVAGQWQVNGGHPLGFFHFSSFDPGLPQQVARRQTRHPAGSREDVQPLLEDYSARLLAAGYAEHAAVPYAFDRFGSGEYISPTLRRLYANPAYGFDAAEDPDTPHSQVYRFGRRHGLISHAMRPAERLTAGDLAAHGRQVRILARLFALALRVVGPNRYFQLMRYLATAASIRQQPKP